jgi:hypothetical protein
MTWKKKGGENLRRKANEFGLARFDQPKQQKRDLRMSADSTSNLGNYAGLGLGAIRLGHPGGETQDLEQGFAAHVAQHDTKRESGDRRTKHHQHTYIDSHNGPLHQSFCSPIVRRVRTSVLDKRVFARIISVSLSQNSSPTLTLVSIAE